MVQWLRLHAPHAEGPGLIPDQGTRSHMLRWEVHTPQLQILPAATERFHRLQQRWEGAGAAAKIQSSQINPYSMDGEFWGPIDVCTSAKEIPNRGTDFERVNGEGSKNCILGQGDKRRGWVLWTLSEGVFQSCEWYPWHQFPNVFEWQSPWRSRCVSHIFQLL